MVMLTIMLTSLIIRILGYAATGRVNPADVLVLIGLAVLGYLANLLVVSLFVSILLVMTRWYKDSEMAVWFASGVSLTDFIRPVFRFSLPIITAIAVLSFFLAPWANQQANTIRERFKQRDDVSMLAPGQFRESAKSGRVFFIESLNTTATKVHNVFISDSHQDRQGIAVAKEGMVETMPNGDRYAVLYNGRRYEGSTGSPDYRIVEFERYSVKVESTAVDTSSKTPAKSMSTLALLQQASPANLGELLWRISLPLFAMTLALIAIPLAHMNPRSGRYTSLIYAVLIYLTYSNLVGLLQAWVAQSKIAFLHAWWPVHLTVLIAAALLLALRQNRFSLTYRLRTILRSDNGHASKGA